MSDTPDSSDPIPDHLTVSRDERFAGEVQIDGRAFVRCSFDERCVILWDGGDFYFDDESFPRGCHIVPRGDAERILLSAVELGIVPTSVLDIGLEQ